MKKNLARLNRRQFTGLLGGAGLAAIGAPGAWAQTNAPSVNRGANGRVVIIGGGPGGGTLAHILRRGSPEIDVTLIEPSSLYTSCFFSNLYLGGLRTLDSITHSYDGLTSIGVNHVKARAAGIDPDKKSVRLEDGSDVPYDKLVISPGIDFKLEGIDGLTERDFDVFPHAYRGGDQSRLLFSQLRAMQDGGTVVVAPPANPFRCPPGPYERVCMIANYLKQYKPRSKIVLVDAKMTFAKQALFMQAFETYYPGMIDVNLTNDIDNQKVVRVDRETKTIETAAGMKIKADVANIIPPQKSAPIAHKSGCADGDWCPVNPENFASKLVPDVYVIGDSSTAGDMPKSAFSANSQAKSVSNDIETTFSGKPSYPARYRNTCWSLLAPNASVKVGAGYRVVDGELKKNFTFVSDIDEDTKTRADSYKESLGWYAGIIAETFNKRVEKI